MEPVPLTRRIARNDGGRMRSELDRWKSQQARAWLNKVRASVLRVDSALERLKEARAAADGLHAASCEHKRGSVTDGSGAMTKAMERVAKAEDDACEAANEYVDLQRAVTPVLLGLEDSAGVALFRYYALGAKDWREVCFKTGFKYDGIMHAVRRALPMVYDAMPHRFRDPLPPAM